MCYQIPMDMKKSKPRSSISKRLGPSAGSSGPLNRGSKPEKQLARRNAPPEISAAQELLAQIAVRILTRKVQKTHDK